MEKILLELPSCYDSQTARGEVFSIPFSDVRDFCPSNPLQDDSVWEQLMGCPPPSAVPSMQQDCHAFDDDFLSDIPDPRKAGQFEELLFEEGSFMDMPMLPGFDTTHNDNFAQANMDLFPDMALEEAFHTMGIQSSMSEQSEVSEACDMTAMEGDMGEAAMVGDMGGVGLPIQKSMSFPEAGSEGQPAQRRRRLTESDRLRSEVLHEIYTNMSMSFSPKAAALRRSLVRK